MKVTVFGATGRTGQKVVAQALARGYEVTAFARSPEKLARFGERIRIVSGDIGDAEAVADAVSGANAVLSVLGPMENKPPYRVAEGTAHIVAAMEAHGVSRLVIAAGAGVRDGQDEPGLLDKAITLLLKLFSRHVYEDMRRTVATVRAAPLAWTVVRVLMLTDGQATGEVKVGYVGKGVGARLTRADMADFMLDQLTDERYLQAAPVISN